MLDVFIYMRWSLFNVIICDLGSIGRPGFSVAWVHVPNVHVADVAITKNVCGGHVALWARGGRLNNGNTPLPPTFQTKATAQPATKNRSVGWRKGKWMHPTARSDKEADSNWRLK